MAEIKPETSPAPLSAPTSKPLALRVRRALHASKAAEPAAPAAPPRVLGRASASHRWHAAQAQPARRPTSHVDPSGG